MLTVTHGRSSPDCTLRSGAKGTSRISAARFHDHSRRRGVSVTGCLEGAAQGVRGVADLRGWGALISLNVITESTGLAIGLAAALLAFDLLAWRVVAAVFDRERLVTGTRG